MSGKNNKNNKQNAGREFLWTALAIIMAAMVLLVILAFALRDKPSASQPTDTASQPTVSQPADTQPQETVPPIQIQIPENITIPLDDGLKIKDVGSYTGLFFEDGSDEVVSGVMMILVTNESDRTLQYAQITLTNDEGEQAQFDLSTVPPGASVVVLEKSRMPYTRGFGDAKTENVVFFREEPSLYESKLQLQAHQGALNVTNISGEDITGDIQIFYKNSAADVYYGGITYMVRIKGGLEAGQLQQLMPKHFNASGSTVMFVVMP